MFVWRLRRNPTLFCCLESPGVNSHTREWSRCILCAVATSVFLSVTTTSRACPTAEQKFNVALSISALMPHMHIHYTWVLRTHTYTQSSMSFKLPFQGTWRKQKHVGCCHLCCPVLFSWLKRRVCQAVCSKASGSSLPKCQFRKQSQTMSEVLSMTAEWSPYIFWHCQLSRSWKSVGVKVFAP